MAPTIHQWTTWTFPNRGRFNNWRPLNDQTIDEVRDEPGVYLLAVPSLEVQMQPRKISRFLGDDPHGVIDIGEAAQLRRRLRMLLKCANTPDAVGHMAGWRLGTLGLLASLGCKADQLLVSWYELNTKEEAYRWEGRLLQMYFSIFGELPPLNYKFNWSKFPTNKS